MTRPVRIGCGSAYAEDRLEPAVDLIERGELDYLSLDCLAERTLVHAQLRRLADPSTGYDLRLDSIVERLAIPAVDRGTKLVTNMGAANPLDGARRAKDLLEAAGRDAKVAAVHGDDVLDLVRERDLETAAGWRLSDPPGEVVCTNAYIGIDGIIEALAAGAEVIVGGRIADPSLFLAPAVHHHGWALDDWDLLAAGQMVGHLLECGTHGTGGNFADPPHRTVPDLWNVGLPAATVHGDGSATVWKLPGTGGSVDLLNCKAQLAYEIHDPSRYLTPDVTVDITGITLAEVGTDEVRMAGARGTARPETLKVLVGVREGWVGEGEISFAGPGAVDRARLGAEVVTKRLAHDGVPTAELRTDLIGVDSIHGPATPAGHPDPWEVRLRVAARCADRAAAEAVAHEVELLYFGPAAGAGARKNVRPVLAMYDLYVPREDVETRVEIL